MVNREPGEGVPIPDRAGCEPSGGRVDVAVLEEPRALAAAWRSFEACAVHTPYQRYDWVAAFHEAHRADGARLVAVRLRGPDGEVLLPLRLRRGPFGVTGEIPGGKHANFQAPLVRCGGLEPGAARAALGEAGRLLGVDAFLFRNMPRAWDGTPNPLVGPGAARSPSDGYTLALDGLRERVLTAAFGAETRRKLKKKMRLLWQVGPIDLVRAERTVQAEWFLEVFFAQKADRTRRLGLADAFADEATRDFLRRAAVAGLGAGRPAVELYALKAGERVVAVFGGAGDATRLCGMFNSHDPDPALSRCSPGEVLLWLLVQNLHGAGRRRFDLGVGEAEYKSRICDGVEELYDATVPVTARGTLQAGAASALTVVKRAVKQSPAVWRIVGAVRRRRGRRAA